MTARRIALLVSALLVVLLGTGVWVLPAMLDWNRYRDAIASFAAERLGRPVRIGGAITLQLLPQPILQAADVVIEDAGDGFGLHVRALRLRVALPSLLAGTIEARELTLQGADLRLPWPPPASLAQRPQAWLTTLRARVEDSRLQVGGVVLDRINATLVTDPDTGTLSVAGVGEVGTDGTLAQPGARQWRFTARLAQPGRDGAAGLDVSLDGQGALQDTGGTFSGQMEADGTLSGRVAGRGPDLSALVPAPALPWRGDGRLVASAGLAVADQLAFEVAGVPVRGAVALRALPDVRLDVAVEAGRLDLDAWLPALLARSVGQGSVPTGIDISAEAATLAGGTLRRLRAAVDLPAGSGGAALRDVSAVLPGDAALSLSGQVGSGATPRLDGTVRLRAPDLPATLRWLQPVLLPAFPGLPSLASIVPRTADVQARLVAGRDGATVSGLRGTVDGGAVSGTAAVSRGARTGVTADLQVAHLNLDLWLPEPAAAASFPVAGVLAGLRTVDADLRLRAEQAEWATTPFGPLDVEAHTEASRIVLRHLEAAPLGVRLSASGQVADTGRITDGRLEAATPDLGVLRPLLARLPRLPGVAERLLRGPGSLAITVGGPLDALTGRIMAELGDLRLDLQPTVDLSTRRFFGAVTLHHPGAPRLLETLGLGATAAWLGDGSFSLVGRVGGRPGRVELQGGTLAAGSLRVSGQVVADGRRISGRLSAETLPLPMVYPRSPDPLPFAALHGWSASVQLDAVEVLAGFSPVLRRASAQLNLQDAVLTLDQVAGEAFGGAVDGTVVVDAAAAPPRVRLAGHATSLGITGALFDTPVDVVAGLGDAEVDLSGTGFSPAALLATLSGTASVTVRDSIATGFDLPAATAALSLPTPSEVLEAVRAAVTGGSTRLGRLDAMLTLGRGGIGIDAALTEQSGTGRLQGGIDLNSLALDTRLVLLPAPPAGVGAGPEVAVRLAGPAGAVTRTLELVGLARWLAERPTAP